jgi:hypothetical protein
MGPTDNKNQLQKGRDADLNAFKKEKKYTIKKVKFTTQTPELQSETSIRCLKHNSDPELANQCLV